jgi:hypothetical protein
MKNDGRGKERLEEDMRNLHPREKKSTPPTENKNFCYE